MCDSRYAKNDRNKSAGCCRNIFPVYTTSTKLIQYNKHKHSGTQLLAKRLNPLTLTTFCSFNNKVDKINVVVVKTESDKEAESNDNQDDKYNVQSTTHKVYGRTKLKL